MMQLDSSIAQPIAKELGLQTTIKTGSDWARRGTDVTGQVINTCPVSEDYIDGLPWGYMFIHNRDALRFSEIARKEVGFKTFIHRTLNDNPTISGLLFIQGGCNDIRSYLRKRFPQYHLVNDCSTHSAAVIPDSIMQPFMRVSKSDPARIRFLVNPLRHYAKGNTLVEITTGPLSGLQGYIIRIDRDRKLVMGVGDMTVAIGGIHKEHFEKVEEVARALKKDDPTPSSSRDLTTIQKSIDASLFLPASFNDVLVIAANLDLWHERALRLIAIRHYERAVEILPFLLEEIGYYFAIMYNSKELDISPVLNVGHRISVRISNMLNDALIPEPIRQSLAAEYEEQTIRHGYLFV